MTTVPEADNVAYDMQSYLDITFPYVAQSSAPYISAPKYVTGGKHLAIVRKRWATDRTDYVQHMFFNGAGFIPWENIWGIWNQLSTRDGEALRRAATILRFLGKFVAGDSSWTPHLPITPVGSNVYASAYTNATHALFLLVNRKSHQPPNPPMRWSGADDDLINLTLPCTLRTAASRAARTPSCATYTELQNVNCYHGRGAIDLETPTGASAGAMTLGACQTLCDSTFECTAFSYRLGECYRRAALFEPLCARDELTTTYVKCGVVATSWTDLYHGDALEKHATCNATSGVGHVTLSVEDGGFGALLLSTTPLSPATVTFLPRMRAMSALPLRNLSDAWNPLPQSAVSPLPSAAQHADARPLVATSPPTVLLPAAESYHWRVSGNSSKATSFPLQWTCSTHRLAKCTRSEIMPIRLDSHRCACINSSDKG